MSKHQQMVMCSFFLLTMIMVGLFYTLYVIEKSKSRGNTNSITQLQSCEQHLERTHIQFDECRNKIKVIQPSCLTSEDLNMYCKTVEAQRVHNGSH